MCRGCGMYEIGDVTWDGVLDGDVGRLFPGGFG